MKRIIAVAITGLALSGCHRRSGDSPATSTPSAAQPAPAVQTELTSLESALRAADLRVEARRGLLAASDPLLARHSAELEAHFHGPVPYPLAFQVAAIGSGRAAVLLQATRGDAQPLVWLVDSSGNIVWAKEHPLGGVKPGVSEPSLAPGPDGHVCLAWCNGSTDSIALRRWADDGGAFADYDALHVDACEALSFLFWPGRGWVLAVAAKGGAVIQLITLNGGRAWGNDGISLPWNWHGAAPLSLALDTIDSLLVFRLGQSGGEGSGEYVFANRFSPEGRAMWPGALSLKRLGGQVRDPSARVVVEPGSEGSIRASVPSSSMTLGTLGTPGIAVEVTSDGTVTRQ